MFQSLVNAVDPALDKNRVEKAKTAVCRKDSDSDSDSGSSEAETDQAGGDWGAWRWRRHH